MQTTDPNPLKDFAALPDEADVRLDVVRALYGGISPATAWRWTKKGLLPAPTKRAGTVAWNVGDLRRAKAPAKP